MWRIAPRHELESEYLPRISRAALWVVALLCLAWLLAGFARLAPNMVWGSLSMGRWIVEHRQLPGNDPLLAGATHAPGGQDRWLLQIGLYLLTRLAGVNGVLLLHAAMVTAACGATMLALRERQMATAWCACGGALMLLVALPMVGYVGAPWLAALGIPTLLWWFRRLTAARWPQWAIPALLLLWANLHVSFVVGLALLLILFACRAWQALLARGERRDEATSGSLRRAGMALAVSLLAGFLAPESLAAARRVCLGLGTEFFPYLASLPAKWAEWPTHLLGDDPALVRPWQLMTPAGLLLAAALLLTACLLRRSPRPLYAEETILGLLALASLLTAQGAMLWWGAIWAWIAIPQLAACCQGWPCRAMESGSLTTERSTMQTLLAMTLAFAVLLIAPCSHRLIMGSAEQESYLTTSATPRYLAVDLQRRELAGAAYVPVEWSDYLLWKTHGKLRPLARPGSRAASAGGWNDTRQLTAGNVLGPNPQQPLWLRVADLYQLDYIIVDRQQNPLLRAAVLANPRADLLYPDQQSLLLQILPANASAQ